MKKQGFLAALVVVFIVIFSSSLMAAEPELISYSVVKGDSMWKIAKSLGVGFKHLLKTNPQFSNPDWILPGETVYYEKGEAVKSLPRGDTMSAYLVKKGDTLTKLAKLANLEINQVLEQNPQIKDRDRIFAGATINLTLAAVETVAVKSYDAGLPPIPIEIRYDYVPSVPKVKPKKSYVGMIGVVISLIILGGAGVLIKKKFAYIERFVFRLLKSDPGKIWVIDPQMNRAVAVRKFPLPDLQ